MEQQEEKVSKVVTANGIDISYACEFAKQADGNIAIELPPNLPPHLIIRVDGEVVCSTGTSEEQKWFAEKLRDDLEAQEIRKELMRPKNTGKSYRPLLLSKSISNVLKFEHKQ